jgi:hypothetical protein
MTQGHIWEGNYYSYFKEITRLLCSFLVAATCCKCPRQRSVQNRWNWLQTLPPHFLKDALQCCPPICVSLLQAQLSNGVCDYRFSGFRTFVIKHFGRIVSTFLDWFWWIEMRQRCWCVGFTHYPTTAAQLLEGFFGWVRSIFVVLRGMRLSFDHWMLLVLEYEFY